MDSSILTTIKKLLGITEEDTSFDTDIIVHINTVLAILYQLGVGDAGFMIEDDSAVWGDYLKTATNLELVKSYIFMKVRQMFDAPTGGAIADSLNKNIAELEWRINCMVDPKQ